MTSKDLFVIIYSCIWAVIIVIFLTVCMTTKCLALDDAGFICNIVFLLVTSIMVFIKPVRRFIDKYIISKL